MRQRLWFILAVAFITLCLDQGTKFWAKSQLRGNEPIDVVQGYLALEYHENPGVAFSLFRDLPAARYILSAFGIVALFLVWRMIRKMPGRHRWIDFAFGLIIGGGFGNLLDRIYMGRVVDFILMHWQRKYLWPVYNAADAAVCVGVGLLLILLGQQTSNEGSTSES